MNTKNINPIVYFIIVFFFGGLGVHKFIDGKIGIGILYILTGGIFRHRLADRYHKIFNSDFFFKK